MSFHTPHGSARYRLPWSWSSFDYRELCRLLFEQCDARFEIAKVQGRGPAAPCSPTAATSTPRWWSTRWAGGACWRADGYQPPEAPLSRGLEVHPTGGGGTSTCGSTARWCASATRWSVPAEGEQRVGAGSYEPRHHVQGRHRGAGPAAGRAGRSLPGQLVSPPAAASGRGRRLLRRRLGRPLLPALGRGHPHRLLLRHRLLAASYERCSRASRTATRALRRYARVQRPARPSVRPGARAAAPDPGAAAAAAHAGLQAFGRQAWSTARSAGTWTRPTRLAVGDCGGQAATGALASEQAAFSHSLP